VASPVAEDDLTDVQRDALIEPARAKMPYFRLLARDPEALRARTLTDLDIFYNVSGGIGRAERELAAAATSRHNGCVFCASVHAASATRESGREADVQRLLDEGWRPTSATRRGTPWSRHPSPSPTRRSRSATRHRAAARGGLDDAEIVDVIGGAAFFNWANRLMLSLGEPECPRAPPGKPRARTP
jgi:alkylhydroperoxidase domain protein